jgi:acetyltransferase-like isoleucine patch superfamily enzyme
MKQFIKRLLLGFFEKTNLLHLINLLQEKQNKRNIRLSITDLGATFYPEAVISNSLDKSRIIVGKGTHIRGMLNIFKYGGKIVIGENCYIGDHSRIWSGESITIGNFVQISHNVNIMDTNAHELDAVERAERWVELLQNGHWPDKGNVLTAPIVIDDYAWIGLNSVILKGVTIGKGAIVSAGAVVTKNVEPFTMVGGNPARFIKTLPQQ